MTEPTTPSPTPTTSTRPPLSAIGYPITMSLAEAIAIATAPRREHDDDV